MKEDFNIMFEKWKNKDLLTWIKDYEDKFIFENNKEFNNDKKEFFEKVYKNSKNIRNYFYNNYLTDMSDNLNNKSDKNIYEYENFFRQTPPNGKKGYKYYKKEEIEYYNNNEDNNNTNNKSNIIKVI